MAKRLPTKKCLKLNTAALCEIFLFFDFSAPLRLCARIALFVLRRFFKLTRSCAGESNGFAAFALDPLFTLAYPRMGRGREMAQFPDELCRRCGRCCYEKLIVGFQVISTTKPCRWLDQKTRLCAAYERRFEVNPQCLTIEQGIQAGVFPADCPYVRGVEGYFAPVEGATEKEIRRFWIVMRGKMG